MKKYVPVSAEDAPARGTAQIDTRGDDATRAAAKVLDRSMITVEPDSKNFGRYGSVATRDENRTYRDFIADHLSLDECLLCHGPESARLLCEAALGLITSHEAAMKTLLRISRTLGQDGRLPTRLESAAIEKIRAAAIGGIEDFKRAVRSARP